MASDASFRLRSRPSMFRFSPFMTQTDDLAAYFLSPSLCSSVVNSSSVYTNPLASFSQQTNPKKPSES
jgi:hypothetical protein